MNLLIVDDDSICSFINNRVAETTGMFSNILSVHNGQDALAFFEQVSEGKAQPPDVILLDLNMPVLNGFDFIEALRGLSFPNKEKIAIIILTSSADSSDLERAQAMGVDRYLLKPLTVNELQTTIFSFGCKA